MGISFLMWDHVGSGNLQVLPDLMVSTLNWFSHLISIPPPLKCLFLGMVGHTLNFSNQRQADLSEFKASLA